MNRIISLAALSAHLLSSSCSAPSPEVNLLPLPKDLRWEKGTVPASAPEIQWVDSIPGARLNGDEAYRLSVRKDGIRIEAVTEKGLWNARQTLSQLKQGSQVPCCTITDWPSFRVRGWMMDVGRTYMSLEELYREVDAFSRFKLNVFHLHLTENEAWRMESLRYPQLNAPETMTRQAGLYYTQEELRALDAYCRERGVTLVPELDMPGHSAAFERAFGFGMQSPKGLAVVKDLLEELMEVFSSEYIHIGTDEVRFTMPEFVPEVVAFVRSKGRKAVSWNPGWNYAPGEIDATQLWSYRGKAQPGIPAVDCRLHYINHFDLFGDIIGLHTSRIYDADEGSPDLAGSIIALWNDRYVPDEQAIILENNLYATALALADRAWRGGGYQYFNDFGTILPESGPAREDFLNFERRMLPYLDNLPTQYVQQGNARWALSPVYDNGGDLEAVFPPEEGKWETERVLTGSGFYLRHVWGPSIVAGVYPEPRPNSTVYARSRVWSDAEQAVGLLFETQNHSRSEHDAPDPDGAWDYRHSRIWLNGEELLPPASTVTLRKGWNSVLVKLPVGAFSTPETRLVKWMFTCAFTTPDGRMAAPVKYADNF
ncbi:MAG: family 20 glycosylhydrolase [Bacteroidales bacterium]|nr:family 20 glycosylhydrolase [Bacteroidales bacterium]